VPDEGVIADLETTWLLLNKGHSRKKLLLQAGEESQLGIAA